jgi:two-component system cell cycle sensor histidine kinase/response regulator CckA
MHDYRLSDLLDISIVQKMADAHYRAAGMPIGIIDAADGSILVGSGWQNICVRFHRTNPVSCQRCRESDDYIKGRLVGSSAVPYKCKNGLRDIGIPIVVAGRHLATLFLGQFFYEKEIPDRDFFTRLAQQYGFAVDDYLSSLDRVPIFSREKVDTILEYNKALASFIADLAENALLKIKADTTIRESGRKFRAIFDQAYQFLGLLSIDGKVMEINKAALKFCGIEEADVIGKPFWETPWWTHSPKLQQKVRQAVQSAAQGEFIRFETELPGADGLLHYFDFSLKLVMDEAGKVVLLIPEGLDISERRRAEGEIKRQAEFLQHLVDAMPYPIFYKDRHGRYLGCNRSFEQFYGISREQIAGKTVYDIAPRELADMYYNADNALFAQPGTQSYEASIQSVDGVLHDVIFHKATFNGTDGRLAGIVGAVIDITARKQAESEQQKLQDELALARRMESIGRLAGGVAHDFNNMLGVILGNAELALEKMEPEHRLRTNLEEILNAAGRSDDLTRQLLTFARKQTVTPKVLNLNAAVDKMLTMLRRLVGEHIDLTWIPGRDLWPVRIDPAQVDQILVNLLVNARDAVAGIGTICIETKNLKADETYCIARDSLSPGEYVVLIASDSGCGMNQETLSNIFEPFFTTKKQGEGTGLGLATVYGVVKQNDGLITAYSKPGKGSSFKIYLPRYKGQADHLAVEESNVSATGGSETVLLVEDEPMLLDLTQIMLEKLGYAVLTAATPGDAMRLARKHAGEIHLLITDVVMPEMNGHELAQSLKAFYPKLKRLFMSGYTIDVIAHHGLLESGVHFVHKPFSMKDLAAKVREVLF